MIDSLTSFRFLTAFIVFLFHCRLQLDFSSHIKIIDSFFSHGAVFMTGFFVLSGFIMTHVYHTQDFSNRTTIFQFYLKRFAKIYPTYLAATLFFFLVFGWNDYSGSDVWTRIVVNSLFVTQGFFENMFPIGLNSGTWSLTVELFLYALFPLLLILSGKSPRFLLFAVALLTVVTVNDIFDKDAYTYANPVMRVGDFVAGMGFYFLKDRAFFKRKDVHLSAIILLLMAVALISTHRYLSWQLLSVMLVGTWITCAYHSTSRIYTFPPLVYCGLISYSFYLWQFAAIKIAKDALPSLGSTQAVIIALILNLSFSVYSYHLLEEPTRRKILATFLKKGIRSQTQN